MPSPRQLKPVVPQPGRPLYQIAKEAIRGAIDAGSFKPGEQIPSTKHLSEQLRVSLVTAHRALQELVAAGVLQRAQGKGTFVHDHYDKARAVSDFRVGLVFHSEASLTDFYHSEILEGVRQAAGEHALDLLLLRFGEEGRNACDGFLYVNPRSADLDAIAAGATRRRPALVVSARAEARNVSWHDVDNVGIGRMAVRHLARLGHRRIGYVGGGEQMSNSRDRWQGFLEGCAEAGIGPGEQHVLNGASWRLDGSEQRELLRMLTAEPRPTAIFAAGYFFALAVYEAAPAAGLRIPADLSVISVDDPPSAHYLSPPLTTIRQPLMELGRSAAMTLWRQMRHEAPPVENKLLHGELVERGSTAPPGA